MHSTDSGRARRWLPGQCRPVPGAPRGVDAPDRSAGQTTLAMYRPGPPLVVEPCKGHGSYDRPGRGRGQYGHGGRTASLRLLIAGSHGEPAGHQALHLRIAAELGRGPGNTGPHRIALLPGQARRRYASGGRFATADGPHPVCRADRVSAIRGRKLPVHESATSLPVGRPRAMTPSLAAYSTQAAHD